MLRYLIDPNGIFRFWWMPSNNQGLPKVNPRSMPKIMLRSNRTYNKRSIQK